MSGPPSSDDDSKTRRSNAYKQAQIDAIRDSEPKWQNLVSLVRQIAEDRDCSIEMVLDSLRNHIEGVNLKESAIINGWDPDQLAEPLGDIALDTYLPTTQVFGGLCARIGNAAGLA